MIRPQELKKYQMECSLHHSESLKVIYVHYLKFDSYNVVRWCPKCGAVVVDCDYDGRINPGQILKMRFPTYNDF